MEEMPAVRKSNAKHLHLVQVYMYPNLCIEVNTVKCKRAISILASALLSPSDYERACQSPVQVAQSASLAFSTLVQQTMLYRQRWRTVT